MSRIPADEIVAEYLAQAAAAAAGLLPTQREEFLDRLHDEVRERVGLGPRHDVEAVSAALADLGMPTVLVARERERLAGGDVKVRDGRGFKQAHPWTAGPPVVEAPAVQDVPEFDGLSAAVVRQRSWDLPTEAHPQPLFQDAAPGPRDTVEILPGQSPRERLRGMRWEVGALAMFVVGPQLVGLLAVLLGAAMVARSTFWDVRDKVRALLGIPVLGALFVLIRAWAESTQLNELESSGARLRAAGESLAMSLQVAVPVLGLLIAAWLGWRIVRDTHWGETTTRAGGSSG